MRRGALVAASALLLAAVASAAAASHVRAEPMSYAQFKALAQPQAKRQIPYGLDLSQFGELWLPQGEGPHPVVVVVHGGCWTASIAGLDIMNLAAEDLARRGFAVWNIEYRRVDQPGGGYPGTFQDVSAAFDYLLKLAAHYRLNLSDVRAIGHSAGGHLALWAAARERLPRRSPLHRRRPLAVNKVVSLGGLADLEAMLAPDLQGCGPEPIRQLIGDSALNRGDPYADTSPAELQPSPTRQVSLHGELDKIAPVAAGEVFTRKATAAGGAAELHVAAGAGHFELITPGTPAWEQAMSLLGPVK